MALRHNHYDAAFEAWLREVRTPHVVVDEQRRPLTADSTLKSMDFIVYSPQGNLLVDVKGRKYPGASTRNGETSGTKWENWATEDDLESLLRWQGIFGGGFRALLVFAYDVVDPRRLGDLEDPFVFRGRTYCFYGVLVDEYFRRVRTRSPSWETVTLPSRVFRELRRPIARFLQPEEQIAEESSTPVFETPAFP